MHNGHSHRRTILTAVIAILAAGAFASTAAALLTSSSGTSQARMDNRASTDPITTTSTTWVGIGSSFLPATVPNGQSRLFNARFTAESACYNNPGSLCAVRIVAIGPGGSTEFNPTSGMDFAFDAPGIVHDESPESHAMERSIRLRGGSYRIGVQYAVDNPTTKFTLDDWHFALETSL
ncbi:MAG: hypothetical protein QOJ46_1142 [bacterium]